MPGPTGWRIRLVRSGDVDAVRRLLPLAEPGLDEEGAMLAQHPGLAAGLQRALRHGPKALLLRDSAGAVVRRSLQDVLIEMALLLVAVNDRGQVDAVLMAFPPVNVLANALQAGVSMTNIVVAAQSVVKIKGVAVAEPARGLGVGAALLDQCVMLYTGLGWQVVYGQFGAESGLDAYYRLRGFEVLDRGAGINLLELLPFPLSIHAMPGEQLFMWRQGPSKAAQPT
jgi:GNAT superfamily N-acetyltransferase